MSFRDIVLSLRRQWLSVLLGLALTAAAGYAVLGAVPPTYRATASVVLLPSPQTLPEGAANPFLSMGSTNAMRDVVTRSAMADTVSAPLLDGTVDTSYQVYPDATAAPILVAVAAGPTPQQTLLTLWAVLEEIDRSLVEIQDGYGVPEVVRVVSQRLSVDSEAEQVVSSTRRAVAATATLGGTATILGALWIDAWRRRKTNASGRDGAAEQQATAEREAVLLDPSDEEEPVQEPPWDALSPPVDPDEVRAGPTVPHHVSSD